MNYEIRNLSKEFGSKKAVRNLSVSLKPGLYGLLGANGAGKTTLMRMLAGVSKPTRGEIFIDGNPVTSPTQLSGRVGYLPQDMGYYPEMNAKEFLSFMAAVKGIPEEDAEVKISQLIRQVNLQKKAGSRIGSYSGGMKQRLGLAQALLDDPEILILDEPTAGLDPKERIRLRNLLSGLARDRIILLSTHIVSDIDALADEILLMKSGQIILKGDASSLCSHLDGKVWQICAAAESVSRIEEKYLVSKEEPGPGTSVMLRLISSKCPHPGAKSVTASLDDLFLFFEGEKEHEMEEENHA